MMTLPAELGKTAAVVRGTWQRREDIFFDPEHNNFSASRIVTLVPKGKHV